MFLQVGAPSLRLPQCRQPTYPAVVSGRPAPALLQRSPFARALFLPPSSRQYRHRLLGTKGNNLAPGLIFFISYLNLRCVFPHVTISLYLFSGEPVPTSNPYSCDSLWPSSFFSGTPFHSIVPLLKVILRTSSFSFLFFLGRILCFHLISYVVKRTNLLCRAEVFSVVLEGMGPQGFPPSRLAPPV